MAVSHAETASTLDAARQLVRSGRAVVPVPRGEKAPQIPGWPSLQIAEPQLADHFSHGENIGLILGEAGGDLVDVDLDVPETGVVAKHFLPTTALISGRMSKPASHRWYVAGSVPPGEKFADLDGNS